MKWQNANEIFPSGEVPLPNGQIITVAELQNSDIATVFQITYEETPDGMITKEQAYFWGDEGEFKIETIYDVYNKVPCVDPECHPLNVYGQQMLNDYLYLNNITLNK